MLMDEGIKQFISIVLQYFARAISNWEILLVNKPFKGISLMRTGHAAVNNRTHQKLPKKLIVSRLA